MEQPSEQSGAFSSEYSPINPAYKSKAVDLIGQPRQDQSMIQVYNHQIESPNAYQREPLDEQIDSR